MTRTEAIARYRALFAEYRRHDAGIDRGWDCPAATMADFNRLTDAAGSDPAARIAKAEALVVEARDYAGAVASAEAQRGVAASNFVLGYSAADAVAGAREYLGLRD